VEISVLATGDSRLFLRDVLRLFCRTFSLGRYLHHGLIGPPPSLDYYLYILSLLRHLASIPRSVTGLVYPSPLVWVSADRHGNSSRGTRDSARRSPSIGRTIDQPVATTCDSGDLCLVILRWQIYELDLLSELCRSHVSSVMFVAWFKNLLLIDVRLNIMRHTNYFS